MSIDPAALRRHYSSLTDDALLEIDHDQLVDEARAYWDDEAVQRRLAVCLPEREAPAVVDDVPAPLPVEDSAPQGWLAVTGGFFGHSALAVLGVSELVAWVPWRDYSDPLAGLIRADILNAVFAMTLGYFVCALRPSLAARWLWLVGIAWLGVGVLRDAAVLPELFDRDGWASLAELLGGQPYLDRRVYVLPAIRVCFYSAGAWCFLKFPFPPLRNLRIRTPVRDLRERRQRPVVVRWLIDIVACAGQCALAIFTSAFVGNQILQAVSLLLMPETTKQLFLAADVAFLLGAILAGYAVHRFWPSPFALWVWLPGTLWFLFHVVRAGSLPADLAPDRLGVDDNQISREWAMVTAISISAVFYSLGAWMHAQVLKRSTRVTDTLTVEAP